MRHRHTTISSFSALVFPITQPNIPTHQNPRLPAYSKHRQHSKMNHPPPSPEKQNASFKNYPYLTPEEFTEAVHHLDSQYCRATLGPLRRKWRLRACTALNTSSSFDLLGPEYNTYIQIVRPLEDQSGSSSLGNDDLSRYLDQFSFGDDSDGVGEGDREMMEVEEGDDEVCLLFMS